MGMTGTKSIGELKQVTFEIQGVSALLMNNPASMNDGEGSKGIGVKNIPTPEEEAAAKAYRLPSGHLYISTAAFKGAIMGAASGQKIAKRAANTIIAAAPFEKGEVCPLYRPEDGEAIKNYDVDVRRAVVQRNGILRARPKVNPWACEITFDYVAELLSEDVIEQVLSQAGKFIGVLDYRPQKKGPFGRFTVRRVQ